ncbi:hypothetical protein MGSAQ_002204 [marine sediment metagenome]|uniref:Uncharacterized protein n=1 Tax=marine sediment metagenome TaxID=412755 RepID=A0A1B6NS50_9ZZZZ
MTSRVAIGLIDLSEKCYHMIIRRLRLERFFDNVFCKRFSNRRFFNIFCFMG